MSEKPLSRLLSNNINSARKFAFFILQEYESGKFATDTINKNIAQVKLNRKDKNLAFELALNSIRRLGTLDDIIAIYSGKKGNIPHPLMNILRLGFYQLRYMDKIPDFAAVNESVELAKELIGTKPAGFVNAVLRNYLREPDKIGLFESRLGIINRIAFRESHPEWLIKRWLKFYSLKDVEFLCSFNNIKPHIVLNTNILKISVTDFCNLLDSNNIFYEKSPLHPDCLRLDEHNQIPSVPGFKEGYFFVQDETPVMLIDKLNITSGSAVLDVCSAPGGKACYSARITGINGTITALDANESRIKYLHENISRLGIENIEIKTADATNYDLLVKALNNRSFDFIILDAPCSNTGVLRKRPEARWRLKESDFARLSGIQKTMLKNVSAFLKPEGKLLYSTCSIDPEENENMVLDFLKNNPEFKLKEQYLFFPKSFQYSDGGYGAVITATESNSI